jgi:DNA-binding NarL/FixJ family response regulator
MPSMSGIEFLEQAKKIDPKVKRILMSAFDMQDGLFEEYQCVDMFKTKPVKMADLIEVVRQLIELETSNVS